MLTPSKGRELSKTIALALTAFVAQGIQVVVSLLFSRSIGLAEFGVVSTVLSVLTLAVLVGGIRTDLAIVGQRSDEDAHKMFCAGVIISSVFAAIVAVGVLLTPKRFYSCAPLNQIFPYRWFFPLGLALISLNSLFLYLAVRQKLYNVIAKSRVFQSVVAAIVGLLFAQFGHGPSGLVVFGILSQSAGIVLFLRQFKDLRGVWVEFRRISTVLRFVKIHIGDLLKSTGAVVLNTSSGYLPPLIISAIYDELSVGAFAIAVRVVLAPVALYGSAASQVFLGEGAESVLRSESDLYSLVKKFIYQSLPISNLMVLAGLFAPYAITEVFGNEWELVGVMSRALFLPAALQLIVMPISCVTTILNRYGVQFLLDLMRFTLVVSSMGVPVLLGKDAVTAVNTYGVCMAIMYLATLFTCIKIAKR